MHRKNQLQVEHLLPDVGRRVAHGSALTLAGQATKLVLNLGSTALLARLLTPHDFGLLAMVAAVIGFATMFADLGLSMATVQRKGITQAQISSLFWINAAAGAAIALVVGALAPAVAWFYNEPRLTGITVLLAANFFLGGLGVQHRALLERQMRFGLLVTIDVLAALGGIAVALTLALRGAGYWALIFGLVATAALTTLLAWILSRWRPGFPSKVEGLGSLLSFGGHLAGFNVVNYWSRNLDNVLIGWWWGAPAVAIYDQAYKLLLLPLHIINGPVFRVMAPALSHIRHDGEKWARAYCRALMAVMLVGAPLSTFCFVFADVLIAIVLGPQWTEAVPIFRYLAIAGIAQCLLNTSGWIYISNGRTDRLFKVGAIGAAVDCLGFLLAVPYGPTGVALTISALTLAGAVPKMAYACHGTPIRLGRVLAAASPAILASVAAAASAYTARVFAGPDGAHGIALAIAAFVFTYLALVLPWPGPRDTISFVLKKFVAATGS